MVFSLSPLTDEYNAARAYDPGCEGSKALASNEVWIAWSRSAFLCSSLVALLRRAKNPEAL